MPTHMKTVERDLTDAELSTLGQEQARLLKEIETLEAELKCQGQLFKSQITEAKEQVRDLTKRINLKIEKEDIECDILINTPENGQKTYVAVSDGRHVAVEDMLESEKQGTLFDEPEQAEEPETVEETGYAEGV